MELSWSTFLLEIINFLVLIWILKRFLYKPVQDIIARRRTRIENRLAEARDLHQDAETLKTKYENRLAAWDRERQELRVALAQELDAERARQMEALQATLAQEREKAQMAESRRRMETTRETEHQALQQGAQFATRLLAQATGPELETRLVKLFLDGLANLSPDQTLALRTQWGEPPESVLIASAFPISEDLRQRLEKALSVITGPEVPVTYEQDPRVLAGLCITFGSWVLHANVRDELKGFAEFAHVTR